MRSVFHRQFKRGLSASAAALFPATKPGIPDFKSTDLIARTEAYLDELPPTQRRLLMWLFVVVELLGGILGGKLRRFSRLPRKERTGLVRRWRRSTILPIRVLGDSVKAVLTMGYVSHPSTVEHIGMFSACDHPHDGLSIEYRPKAISNPGQPQ